MGPMLKTFDAAQLFRILAPAPVTTRDRGAIAKEVAIRKLAEDAIQAMQSRGDSSIQIECPDGLTLAGGRIVEPPKAQHQGKR